MAVLETLKGGRGALGPGGLTDVVPSHEKMTIQHAVATVAVSGQTREARVALINSIPWWKGEGGRGGRGRERQVDGPYQQLGPADRCGFHPAVAARAREGYRFWEFQLKIANL